MRRECMYLVGDGSAFPRSSCLRRSVSRWEEVEKVQYCSRLRNEIHDDIIIPANSANSRTWYSTVRTSPVGKRNCCRCFTYRPIDDLLNFTRYGTVLYRTRTSGSMTSTEPAIVDNRRQLLLLCFFSYIHTSKQQYRHTDQACQEEELN
jgi:hypothetical protein